MWKAGISSSDNLPAGPRVRGYTLIELSLVVVVIGLAALLIIPSFRTGADLKSSSRRLAGIIGLLTRESLARREMLRLTLDLDEGTVLAEQMQEDGTWVPLSSLLVEKETLPRGQRLRDVETLRQGKVTLGRAYIFFSPQGRPDPAVIHLALKDAVLTLATNPLTGRVQIRDGDLEGTDFALVRPREI